MLKGHLLPEFFRRFFWQLIGSPARSPAAYGSPAATAITSNFIYIVKFEIIDRIRNCHVYGPPFEDNHKAPFIVRNMPSGL